MTTSGSEQPDDRAAAADAQPRRSRQRRPRRVVRRGTEREAVLGVPDDERGGHGSNDDRLRRDVPPHW